jgi:hypothetical protein
MRGVIAFFMVIALGGLGIHGYGGSSDGGPAERVIRAEPEEIVEAMNRSLRGDGMEVVSRSDSGDYYRLELTAEEMRRHPKYERLAEQGDLTFNAHVTSRQIEFTANFESGLVAGFNIQMIPTSDGSGTLARVNPLLRDGGREENQALHASLQRNFSRYGRQTLETIANVAESERPQPVL